MAAYGYERSLRSSSADVRLPITNRTNRRYGPYDRSGSGAEVPITPRQCLPLGVKQTGPAKKGTFRA